MSGTQPTGFTKIKGHLLSILIIGVVAVSITAIVEEKGELTGTDLDALMAFDISAVAAMSWHAYSLAVSTSGLTVKQGDTAKVQ